MANFIPALHFKPSKEKISREWCNDVVQFYHFQSQTVGLLDGKDVKNIDGYADGDYDMTPYKKMFISFKKQLAKSGHPSYSQADIDKLNKVELNFDRVPLIVPKLNSAIATTQKIPFEVKCVCNDPLAQKHKKEDLEFLKKKPEMEAMLQPVYDSMNLGKVDLGTTKYSSVPYNSLPFDFDPNDEQEFMVFANLIYNLAPEASFATILNYYTEYKRVIQLRGLETRDQYKYAVSTNRVYQDKMVGLPQLEYIYPGNVRTNWSRLPDYSDNVYREVYLEVTPMELFKYFPDEICDEKTLENIISGTEKGFNKSYCGCNGISVRKGEWDNYKMSLVYVEVKSVDREMVGTKKTKRDSYQYFTEDETQCTGSIWGQNTYCFYWLANTKFFFGIDKLPFAYRKKGQERYQQFSTNIYKSQPKSAVELCIGENKKAQIADIKLQYHIIMSLPDGRIIDMKAIRNAIQNQLEDEDKYSEDQIMERGMESNVWMVDTEGLDKTKDGGQYMPIRDLPGGIKNSIEGYYRVIMEADSKISQYTNINQQLTGQSPNPEGLVGMQKLLINSSLNGLYYVNEAIVAQYTCVYNLFANFIKQAIEAGGKTKQAVESIIGTNKVQIIDSMDALAIHDVGITIKLGQREEERAKFEFWVEKKAAEGKIDSAAYYYILNTPDPQDAFMLLAMFERRARKREDMIRQEQMAAQQEAMQQQGQNMVANTQAKTQGDLQKIQAETVGEGELMKLANQLGVSAKTLDGLIKRQLQAERLDGQVDKSLKTLYAKNNLEAQQPLPA